MHGVSVFYNALLGSRSTRVVVTFQSRVSGGTEIFLRAPMHYSVVCSLPNALKQLALPGDTPMCLDNVDSGNFDELRELILILNGTTLGVGEFAFGITCDLPLNVTAAEEVQGIDGTWSLAIRNNGTIVESIFGIPPLPIANVGITLPVLAWSDSAADSRSLITVGFTVEVPIAGVRAVLFVFPSRVLHDVRVPSDLEIVGPNFPYIPGAEGLLSSEMSMLRLQVTASSIIPEGTFRFHFPVILPWEMPSQNLWHVTLCGTATCLRPDDPNVVISFVLAGFNIGERPTSNYGEAASGALRKSPRLCLNLGIATIFIHILAMQAT
jgi:hypothetical protein